MIDFEITMTIKYFIKNLFVEIFLCLKMLINQVYLLVNCSKVIQLKGKNRTFTQSK